MPPEKVMIIRHAEKPVGGNPPFGVDPRGEPDKHSLTVEGWAHAGALVGFFASEHDAVALPTSIYAARPDTNVDSPHGRRPYETVLPLSLERGLTINKDHAVGEEAQLAAAVLREAQAVLVCWEHHAIPKIVHELGVRDFAKQWPDGEFDRVWVLDRRGNGYEFSEISQQFKFPKVPLSFPFD